MMLYKYAEQTQRLLRDSRQHDFDLADLFDHINTARREVAMRAECIIRVPLVTGSCVSASVIAAGTGYTDPTVTISGPDWPSGAPPYPNGLQATAQAVLLGGSIAAVDIQEGGAGYFQPTATIADPTGTGASITVITSPLFVLNQGQEVYNFEDIDVSVFPGVDSVLSIRSVTVIYSNWRYSLAHYSFSTYQAKIRQFSPANSYQYVPGYFAQVGQGNQGSLYMYPVPSQTYQCELHCICLPSDMTSDTDFEPIPLPWTDAVKFFAAAEAMLSIQNMNAARMYYDLFDKFMARYSGYARPGYRANQYGRW